MKRSRKELTTYWLKAAESDLKVVKHLFEKGDYMWALFIAHLVLEKILKGYYVKQVGRQVPHSHNLIHLANRSKLKLSERQTELLEDVTRFNIEVRYPDEKFEFYKICTKEYTRGYLKKIKEFYQWIKRKF